MTGGRYEETAFHSVGSGSLFARGSLKKLYRDGPRPPSGCVEAVVQALYDAADDDSATGGPDLTRRIFPVVQVITAEGGRRIPDDEVAEVADRVIAARMTRPDGPAAPLTGGGAVMSMPFYVSPEQLMKDRADFARKGIARGRSMVAVQYADGILLASENVSQALHKVSEIYDRIAFAAVGRYNEFENLRIAGVRLADMRGYAYDRRDVTGRGLANAYAQTLGTIFSSGGEKPYEVEIFVAEIGDAADGRPDLPAHLRRPGRRRARVRRDRRRRRRRVGGYLAEHYQRGRDARPRRWRSRWPRWAARPTSAASPTTG